MWTTSHRAPHEWDTWLSSTPSATLMQTTMWAERCRRLLAYQPQYVSLASSDFEVRAVLFWRRGRGGQREALWHGHPAIRGEWTTQRLAGFLDGIRAISAQAACATVCRSLLCEGFAFRHATKRWQMSTWATLIVELTSETECWERLDRSARGGVRRADRSGVVVSAIGDLAELRDYYSFAERCATQLGKPMYGFADFSTMWEAFRGRVPFEVFVARLDGEIAAGLGVWGFGRRIQEWGSFQAKRDDVLHARVGDALKWHVIRWALSEGLAEYDLAGVSPCPTTAKEAGIRVFKEKWGGRYTELQSCEATLSPFRAVYGRCRAKFSDGALGISRRLRHG